MATYVRDIGEVVCIDYLGCGDVLYADVTSPGNTAGKTGWNELASTINALGRVGNPGAFLNGHNVGDLNESIVGNYGASFNETAGESVMQAFAILPGYDRYELIYDYKLRAAGSTTQELKIEVGYGTIFQTLDHIGVAGSSAPVTVPANSQGIRSLTGTVNPSILPTTGASILVFIQVSSIKNNPVAPASATTSYWDGTMSVQLRFYKDCP